MILHENINNDTRMLRHYGYQFIYAKYKNPLFTKFLIVAQ